MIAGENENLSIVAQRRTSGGKPENKLLWRPETVAFKLDISLRTLERWRASGRFPPPDIRYGNKLMWWRVETVLNWIQNQHVIQE